MPRNSNYGFTEHGFTNLDSLTGPGCAMTTRSARRNPAVDLSFFTDAKGKKLSKAKAQNLLAKSTHEGTLAFASLITSNEKVGDCYVTSSAQSSCPDGKNSSYRCAFLGEGCYAEMAPMVFTTYKLNRNAEEAQASSIEVAKAEAAAMDKLAGYLNTYEGGPSKPMRIHIVGDAVTDAAARIISKAAEPFIRRSDRDTRMTGHKLNGDAKVWGYTHGWRDVSRSSWGEVSILASCETADDLKRAYAKGYALAAVVPKYDNAGGPAWGAYQKAGFTILPCPNVVRPEEPKCNTCGICMREGMLREKKIVIAFETHGAKNKAVDNALIQIGANL